MFGDKNPKITLMALPRPVVVASMVMDNLNKFDNSDAFVSSANFNDGTPLTARQLDILTDSHAGQNHLLKAARRV